MTWRRIALLNLLVLLGLEAVCQGVWQLVRHEDMPRDPRSWLAQARLSFRNGLYVADHAALWRLSPGYRGGEEALRFWGDAPLAINTDGMRGPERRPDAKVRVLVIGGSHPMGMYVSWEQSYAGQLERLLAADGHSAQVLNASAPGYTSWQARRWLEAYAADFAPTAIVFDAGVNDTLPLTTEYPIEDKALRAAPAWASSTRSWLEVSATFRLLQRWLAGPPPVQDGTPTAGTRVSRDDHASNVRAVVSLGARIGAEVVVVNQLSVDLERTGRATCIFDEREFADRRVDLCQLFGALGASARDLFVDPIHANAAGHAQIAEAIAAKLHRSARARR